MLFFWSKSSEKNNIINIAAQSTTTVTKIAELVRSEMELPTAKIIYTGGKQGWIGDVPKFTYDTTKITQLGWTPKRNSTEAVQESIQKELLFQKT